MRILVLAAVAATFVAPVVGPECEVASIDPDGNVEINWPCVEKTEKDFVAGQPMDIGSFVAHVLKAVRDGKAKAK